MRVFVAAFHAIRASRMRACSAASAAALAGLASAAGVLSAVVVPDAGAAALDMYGRWPLAFGSAQT
ncbi:hypothetical protein [Dactylosporangium darangshiense]|uniref:hypothetical protein n=1 Tax=Dactylosporangium darangshiense TaxID=579108 RepID=UPI00362F39C0